MFECERVVCTSEEIFKLKIQLNIWLYFIAQKDGKEEKEEEEEEKKENSSSCSLPKTTT